MNVSPAGGSRQLYPMCPAQLAEGLEMEKGEEIEWVVEDKHIRVIRLRHTEVPAAGVEERAERSRLGVLDVPRCRLDTASLESESATGGLGEVCLNASRRGGSALKQESKPCRHRE